VCASESSEEEGARDSARESRHLRTARGLGLPANSMASTILIIHELLIVIESLLRQIKVGFI